MRRESLLAVLLTAIALLALSTASHAASSIGQGIFEVGNYSINGNFSVGSPDKTQVSAS